MLQHDGRASEAFDQGTLDRAQFSVPTKVGLNVGDKPIENLGGGGATVQLIAAQKAQLPASILAGSSRYCMGIFRHF